MQNYHPADLVDILRKIENLIRQGVVYQTKGDRVKVRSGKLVTAWLPWFTHRAGKSRSWWRPSIGEQVFILSPNGNLELGCVLPSLYCNDNAPPSDSEHGCFVEFPDGATFKYEPADSSLTINGIKTAFIDAGDEIILNSGKKITMHAGTEIAIHAGKKITMQSDDKMAIHATNTVSAQSQFFEYSADTRINFMTTTITYSSNTINLNAPLVNCADHVMFRTFSATGSPSGASGSSDSTSIITGNLIHIDGILSSNGVVLDSHVHTDVHAGDENTGGPK
ncbi:Baseplate assembly protein V [Gilliamella apicola]|nr:phage baseplate assembly protein V [Gilliamella apicola]KFA59049.1 Baseplate assembly protein V [Gilliamella apicola]